MTTAEFYFFIGNPKEESFKKWIKSTVFTLQELEMRHTGIIRVQVSQTLTNTQKNTIKDDFRGAAYIEFS